MKNRIDRSDFDEVLSEFKTESDRGSALIAASAIEDLLENLARKRLLDCKASNSLFSGFNSPLGTFSSKAIICRSLGLIAEDEFSDIEVIRKIRNEFGHNWKGLNFETQKIRGLTMNLEWFGPLNEEEKSRARDRFNYLVALLLSTLSSRVDAVDPIESDLA